MMLRELLSSFLFAALLVPITSDQSRTCFICGDGFEVGNPYAKTSVQCPNQTACTCEELALAGLQGSIPIEKCSNVSSAIFTTCDCQENSTPKTWFPTFYPSSDAPIATPNLFWSPSTFTSDVPVATTEYPSFTNAPTPTPTFPPDYSQLGLLLNVVTFGAFCFGPCICACLFLIYLNAGGCMRCCAYHSPRPYMEGTQPNMATIPVPTPALPFREARPRTHLDAIRDDTIGDARSRRHLVLAALFPKEGKLEGIGSAGGRSNLTYDPQSKHYVFCEDAPDATACSICMEFIVPSDDSVTGLCSHSYHRECIMNWLQGDHDDCPNCRQPMWDPETYEMIDQCIKDHEWHSPYAL